MARAISHLPTFKELMLPDLRELISENRRDPLPEIQAANSVGGAVELLEFHMGFVDPSMQAVSKSTPIGSMNIARSNLRHIVEKRLDARERYVLLALDTLAHPFEIWETLYDDEMARYMFIGTYQQKQQMLAVVAPWDGRVLWNFSHQR